MYWLYIYIVKNIYMIINYWHKNANYFIHSKTKARKENNEYAGQNVSFHNWINMVRWGHDVVKGSAVSVV